MKIENLFGIVSKSLENRPYSLSKKILTLNVLLRMNLTLLIGSKLNRVFECWYFVALAFGLMRRCSQMIFMLSLRLRSILVTINSYLKQLFDIKI